VLQRNHLDTAIDHPPFQVKIKQPDAVDPVWFIGDVAAIPGSGVVFNDLGDDGSKIRDIFFQEGALSKGLVGKIDMESGLGRQTLRLVYCRPGGAMAFV